MRAKRGTSLDSPIGTSQGSGMRPLKAGLVYFLLVCSRVGLGANSRTLGGAAVRSHNGPAHRSHYFADRDDCLGPMGDATLRGAPDSPLDDPNGSGGARDFGTRRDRRCSLGARVIPTGISCELRDRSQRHFGGDVPAVYRNAVSGRTINTPPRRRDPLSLRVHAKGH